MLSFVSQCTGTSVIQKDAESKISLEQFITGTSDVQKVEMGVEPIIEGLVLVRSVLQFGFWSVTQSGSFS